MPDVRRGRPIALTMPLSSSQLCSYVELIQGSHVRVRLSSRHSIPETLLLTADRPAHDVVIFPYDSEAALATLLAALRDAQVAFVHQEAGWPPSAVFEDLREKALLSGTFLAIFWRGPGKPNVVLRQHLSSHFPVVSATVATHQSQSSGQAPPNPGMQRTRCARR